jgi:hypothetical protein
MQKSQHFECQPCGSLILLLSLLLLQANCQLLTVNSGSIYNLFYKNCCKKANNFLIGIIFACDKTKIQKGSKAGSWRSMFTVSILNKGMCDLCIAACKSLGCILQLSDLHGILSLPYILPITKSQQTGFRFTGLQVYRFTGLQVYRFTGLQVYRFTGLQVYRFTGLHVYRFTGLQVYRSTGLQVYRSTGLQVYRLTGLQASRLPGFQASRLPGFQASRLPGLQAYRLTGLQAYRLTGLQAYRLTGLQAYRFGVLAQS